MKVIIIHGQDYQGSTYYIGRCIAEKLENATIVEYFLPRDFNQFCTGCAKCFNEGGEYCPHYQEISPISLETDSADVVILTSPVHELHITGTMKVFLEHNAYCWLYHRPKEEMFSKQAVCVSTAAGMGVKSTNKELEENLFWLGIPKIYKIGIVLHASSIDEATNSTKRKIEKKVKKISKKINKNVGKVRPGIKTKVLFYFMRMIQNEEWSAINYNYWKEKGWLGKARPWKK
jgi:multimeric flavodoxin WrbA